MLAEDEVARRVELRWGRQAVLLDRPEDPLRLWAIVDESVLHIHQDVHESLVANVSGGEGPDCREAHRGNGAQ